MARRKPVAKSVTPVVAEPVKERPSSLFSLTEEAVSIDQQICRYANDHEGECSDELYAMLKLNKSDAVTKINSYLELLDSVDSKTVEWKAKVSQIEAKLERLARVRVRLRTAIQEYMIVTQRRSLNCDKDIVLKPLSDKVTVKVSELPDEFCTEELIRSPMIDLIKAMARAGQEIQGVIVERNRQTITIR